MNEQETKLNSSEHRVSIAERGQALVETALVLPILIVVLLGGAELARVAFAAIEVANAARAGVAYGAQNTATSADTPGIQNAAVSDVGDMAASLTTTAAVTGTCSNPSVLCTGSGSTCTNQDCSDAGDHIVNVLTVTTTASFDPLIHLPGIPTTYALQGQAIQKVLPQ
jgi:Flp pilus assembly protein TadG